MTLNAAQAAATPLTTERDKAIRIRDLLAPACHPAQLWVLMLDERGYQTPILIPVSDLPDLPDVAMVDALIDALSEEEQAGPLTALFVLERLGSFGAGTVDHCWAAALGGACDRAGLPSAGIFLLSPGGVVALTA